MPTILLTNDDGPPNPKDSPFILGLYRHLTKKLGWDVKVVIPNAQKSWIGKAFHIKDITKGNYFYPKESGEGEVSLVSRPLKDGELAEWILLDGTPATCANIALHNLFPGKIDLVVNNLSSSILQKHLCSYNCSDIRPKLWPQHFRHVFWCSKFPNFLTNIAAAFALSSGTVGAAMSAALSGVRAIAVSYGIVENPPPMVYNDPAQKLATEIIKHLWENWGSDDLGLRNGEIDIYNINIPLIGQLLSEEGPKIYWTNLWRNSYGRLFKSVAGSNNPKDQVVKAPGPDASSRATETMSQASSPLNTPETGDLVFKWSPDMAGLIWPDPSNLPVSSDGWAIHHGHVSVTPLRATFAEPEAQVPFDKGQLMWKMKL
ncbi:survival protein sure-like phosphatase/nucleotidase [Crepidotus variabilis]|uniref:Survival protein sure-like phosphatase/nucleotidase n=1 Tax=Crepidotus variabilis TaxID=179855 RepID=A0A9P6JMT0_9AGAR|nr:survival protein sure-like phosphatase/nucleotidase [Crepidotus variabilis]